ncbi:MAG: PAS domain S-box protein [Halothiobacillaceae bacterium]
MNRANELYSAEEHVLLASDRPELATLCAALAEHSRWPLITMPACRDTLRQVLRDPAPWVAWIFDAQTFGKHTTAWLERAATRTPQAMRLVLACGDEKDIPALLAAGADECLTESKPAPQSVIAALDRAAARRQSGWSHVPEWLAGMPDLLYLREPGSDRLRLVSGQTQDLVGLPPRALLHARGGWLPQVHPEDRPWVQAMLDAWRRGESRPEMRHSYRLQRTDGSLVWVEDRCRRWQAHDGRTLEVGILNDIKARKEAEAAADEARQALDAALDRNALVMEASDIGLWDWNIVADRIIWDQHCYEQLGFAPNAFSLTFRSWLERLHPDDQTRVEETVWFQVYSGKPLVIEFRIRDAMGAWRWIEGRGRVVAHDSRGHPLRMVGTHLEIHERKTADERMERLLANSKAVIYTMDSGHFGRFHYVSANMQAVTGWKAEQVLADPDWLAHHADQEHFPHVVQQLNEWIERGAEGVLNFQCVVFGPDGKRLWMENQVAAMRNDAGEVTEIVGACLDATRKIETNRRLAEREALLQSTLDALDDLLFVIDADGTILDCYTTPEPERFPFLRQGRPGTPFHEVLPNQLARELAERLAATRRDGKPREFEFAFGAQWFLFKLSARQDWNGGPNGVVCLVSDLTARKASEQRIRDSEALFHGIFDNARDAIVMIDPQEGRLLMANPRFSRLFDIPLTELNGLDLADISPDDGGDGVARQYERLLQGVEEPLREVRARRRDGRVFYVDITGGPVRVAGKQNFVLLMRDATRRRQIEGWKEEYRRQLEQVNQELDALNRNLERRVAEEVERNRQQEQLMMQQSRFSQMGEMLSMIAHQWRQPLNAISLAAINLETSISLGDASEEKTQEAARFVQDQTAKMSETITDFMEFFKPSRRREHFVLRQVLQDVEQIVGAQLRARSIDYQVQDKTADQPELTIYGHRNELSHVLLNLIGNARDAIEQKAPKKPRITVKAECVDHSLCLSVDDNGGGIPVHVLDRVFDPYFSTKGYGKGTGIGLYMVRTIIERNFNGRVTVENGPEGARFSLCFPLQAPSDENDQGETS